MSEHETSDVAAERERKIEAMDERRRRENLEQLAEARKRWKEQRAEAEPEPAQAVVGNEPIGLPPSALAILTGSADRAFEQLAAEESAGGHSTYRALRRVQESQ
jgi:hypothetical protein